MTNEQKILVYDMLVAKISQYQTAEDMPILAGHLNSRQGINGFEIADIGHPVFEYKDRYVIYLESKSPVLISEFGKEVRVEHFKVAVPYYKKDLAPAINFSYPDAGTIEQ